MLPLRPEQEAKLRVSHTKQVEKLISQIHEFTEKNFPISIEPDGNITSSTCIPHYINYADEKRVEELKTYVDLLQQLLTEEREQNMFWYDPA
ncbi:hypothetical protein ACF8PD_12350 [Vibrio plantisponsor]|uniref:hypothetical protein n=1 Tax=Vibrio plantisponsor TaxID=664643 RepID=UPI00370BA786